MAQSVVYPFIMDVIHQTTPGAIEGIVNIIHICYVSLFVSYAKQINVIDIIDMESENNLTHSELF